jgi:hypothetical protein
MDVVRQFKARVAEVTVRVSRKMLSGNIYRQEMAENILLAFAFEHVTEDITE